MVSAVLISVSALNGGIGSSIGIGLKCGIGTSLLETLTNIEVFCMLGKNLYQLE